MQHSHNGKHIKMEVRALLRTGWVISFLFSEFPQLAPCGRSEADWQKARKLGPMCFCFHIRKYWRKHSRQIVTFFKAAQSSSFIADSYQSENGSETSFRKQRSYWKKQCHAWLMKSSDSWGNFDLHFKSTVISTQNRFWAKKKVNSAFPWR